MDYVVGSVAALISGNVTPSRPKLVRRALTPIKHQQSPNVTPKSELVDDRSIFLSPTLQKKKAIVKKSPKRIFQNPDLDVTSENENNSNPSSPKLDKVKKHLNEELEAQNISNKPEKASKSPKKKRNKSVESSPPRDTPQIESPQSANENTPKKQKKRKISDNINQASEENLTISSDNLQNKKNRKTSVSENSKSESNEQVENETNDTPKKKKKKSKKTVENLENQVTENQTLVTGTENVKSPKKKNKKRKKKSKAKQNELASNNELVETNENQEQADTESPETGKVEKTKSKKQNLVNPNAITDKDTDSEHESDDEIVSENEEANKEVLDTGPVDESSDEEEESKENEKKETKVEKAEKGNQQSEDEVKRTLFVGNVPFSKKCKKEIKKIFSKYGDIETVRIRTVPVKDGRVTPKLAVIKSELHPERTTVNVYIKYKDESSIEQALSENNTVLNGCHLRVSRSAASGAEHDARLCVFVGNLPFALEDDALRDTFKGCGEIVSVRIVRDRKTNAGKGFGYVNFASKDSVELALELSEEDLTIKNRILRVKRSTQTPNKQKNQTFGQNKKFQGRNQGTQNVQNRNQFGNKGGNFRQKQMEASAGEGAFRRINNKRQHQDRNDGPPNKRQKNINQPHREKKVRKEFVGMTAEKRKKPTFNKGQKKKKALSEILTKYS